MSSAREKKGEMSFNEEGVTENVKAWWQCSRQKRHEHVGLLLDYVIGIGGEGQRKKKRVKKNTPRFRRSSCHNFRRTDVDEN